MKRSDKAGYVAMLAACFFVALAAGWTRLGAQFDADVYDFLFGLNPPEAAEFSSVVVGIDEESLADGGVGALRRLLAEALPGIAASEPKAVVVDLILADRGDEAEDGALAEAFARTPNLILATGLRRSGEGWDDPRPEFAKSAAAIAHVHSDPDPYDNVLRQIPLEKALGRRRVWALALEAFRLSRGGGAIVEDPAGVEVGGIRIPARRDDARSMRIHYLRPAAQAEGAIPEVPLAWFRNNAGGHPALRGKVVFVGITADSAAQDRHMTPYSFGHAMPGVQIHANAYETMARQDFLRPASNLAVVAACLLLTVAAGVLFWRYSGWRAYGPALALLGLAHVAPYAAFRNGWVFPYAPPFSTAWLSIAAAATAQYFFVRGRLGRSEAEKERYQRAIHFVAHEMRTPLTAIQGSSELMGRYKLPEEKRGEMARMINAESKRLARLIQAFLDVERLTAGQVELKRAPFDLRDVVDVCLGRVKSLAEGKRIAVETKPMEAVIVDGDRELMEYAVYNLLTNAIKYSPAGTRVSIGGGMAGSACRLSVEDQGIGMDEQEMKGLFRKFYRTKKAEASGEKGTGIGLSLVQQIVTHHGGRVEVASTPGAGSCFTIVIPASVPQPGS
ncbi:MAG: CHASE2 domain-containing protein [Bryobacteraceae bacterium]